MKQINILVTGAGALLGQGILRTLRDVKGYDLKIISADPDFRSSGHWLADVALTLPLAKDPNYIAQLEEIINTHDIKVLLIGTDVELLTISVERKRLESKYGLKIIVASPEVIKIGDDKWLTTQFLHTNNFPYPKSSLSENLIETKALADEIGFPLIAKPRIGARSIGLYKIDNNDQLENILDKDKGYIIQEYLSEETGEFTAGVVVFEGKVLSNIVLRRDLRDGNTYRAYYDGNEIYNDFISDVAIKLQVEGPCNFQFRIKNGKPVIFEINSRFSGTTPIRAIFGLNEIQIIFDYLFNNKLPNNMKIRKGVVLRTISDVFIGQQEWQDFESNRINEDPSGQFISFN